MEENAVKQYEFVCMCMYDSVSLSVSAVCYMCECLAAGRCREKLNALAAFDTVRCSHLTLGVPLPSKTQYQF